MTSDLSTKPQVNSYRQYHKIKNVCVCVCIYIYIYIYIYVCVHYMLSVIVCIDCMYVHHIQLYCICSLFCVCLYSPRASKGTQYWGEGAEGILCGVIKLKISIFAKGRECENMLSLEFQPI